MKKEKSLTNDLFGIELITCPNCMGEGEIDETIKKYKIIKFRKSGTQKVMEHNLTLDEAKKYCSRPDTKGKNWFCGFTQQ